MKRHARFFLRIYVIPVCFILLLIPVIFLLPPDSSEKFVYGKRKNLILLDWEENFENNQSIDVYNNSWHNVIDICDIQVVLDADATCAAIAAYTTMFQYMYSYTLNPCVYVIGAILLLCMIFVSETVDSIYPPYTDSTPYLGKVMLQINIHNSSCYRLNTTTWITLT